ncbi:MAG TPA: DNA/RNA non-specific endonuclease [Jiangellaceae bacterium]
MPDASPHLTSGLALLQRAREDGDALGRELDELIRRRAKEVTRLVDQAAQLSGGHRAAEPARVIEREARHATDLCAEVLTEVTHVIADACAELDSVKRGPWHRVRVVGTLAFNQLANRAEPNTVYQHRGVRWKTDHLARPVQVSGRVKRRSGLTKRLGSRLQNTIGKEGRPTDVGFHLLAHSLGGPTNRLNVVPGNGRSIGDGKPNLNQGEYKSFELEISQLLKEGRRVRVRIRAVYDHDNTSTRPDFFVYSYQVGDGRFKHRTFVNK